MKQKIEIEVPDGKSAVWKDGKVVFEDIKCQLPKTWKQFCKQYKVKEGEYSIYDNSIIIEADADKRDADFNRNVLPNKQAAEQHLALMQLHQLRDCYRQGWEPVEGGLNFNIYKKYEVSVNDFGVGISAYPTFLSFPTREIALKFVENFKDLLVEARELI